MRSFWSTAQSGRAAVQVPAPSLMLDDGEVERRVRLLRPMERPAIPLATMAQTHWQEADRADFARAWEAEIATVPEFTDSDLHIVTGLLLPIWKRLPNDSMRVYRLQTDDGERIIGRLVSPAWVAQAVDSEAPTLSPADAFTAVLDGRTVLQLQDGLELRRVKVMGEFRIELSGFTDGMVERLKAMGLISEIISWKLRLFVPTGATGPANPGAADGALSARPHRRQAGGVRRTPCPRKPPNWRTVSRAMPRRCAATISPTAAARAATGSSATSPTRRAAACSFACTGRRRQGRRRQMDRCRHRPAWRSPRPHRIELRSRSSGAMSSSRPAGSSGCRSPRPLRHRGPNHRTDCRRRRAGCW